MFKRIQVKLILLYSALFILVQASTYLALFQIATPQIENQIKQQLSYSRSLVLESIESNTNKLAEGTRLLATDFGFRSAVATSDKATILSALQNLTNRIGSDHAMLISLENEIIADTKYPSSVKTQYFKNEALIEQADEYDVAADFMVVDGELLEFVIVPVLAPIPIAWIGVSVNITDDKAQEIRALLPEGLDLSFFAQTGPAQASLLASTLEDETRARMTASQLLNSPKNVIQDIKLDNDDRVMILIADFPFIEQQQRVFSLLEYSMNVAFRPYKSMIIGLSVLAVISLLALVLGSIIIARGVARPMRLLAEAASRIRVGNYTPVRSFKQHFEVDQLATSFNHMIQGIEDREKKIMHQAEHDLETGLPNRLSYENFLAKTIENCAENGNKITTMIISIQRFDEIQNTLGYSVGEDLIKNIVPCLESAAPDADMIARLSTTSFALILTHLDEIEPRKFAKKILGRFNEPIHMGDVAVDVSLLIGIANYPADAKDVESLLRRTNIASLQAIENLDHIALYDAEKDSHYADKLSMMGELRKGIEQGEVVFHYQPKIDISTGKISHVEALVRWTHPTRGFISPDDFIPMAEQTGQIQYLTQWGLEEAIKQCRHWRDQHYEINVAINLSAHDLTDNSLPKAIKKLLDKYRVRPEWLVLEVTESAVMKDPDLALYVLYALNGMGLTLSIDDYGTGYSSMSYLKKLPVQEIKIDKSFVLSLATNKEDEIIVKSTISLGHNLGLKVTAEGVEDEKSYKMLKDFGCDLAQGYLFSKALPASELEDFIKSSPYGHGSKKNVAPIRPVEKGK